MLSVDTFETVSEAAAVVNDRARYLAGGTLVMRAVTYGDQSFDRIVRAREVDRSIQTDAAGLRIGAGATMADVLASRDLEELHPVARSIGGPAVRNMATVAGNLFAENPYGDFAAALLALDAQAVMVGGQSKSIADILANRDRPSGLIEAITVPRVDRGTFRFRKVSRVKPKGVAVMTIAAVLKSGEARVVFGNMGPTPMRATGAEQALAGGLDAGSIAAACSACLTGLTPADDALASAWYRREVAPIHLRRLLESSGA